MFARHLPASEDDPDFSEECVQPLPYPEEVAYPYYLEELLEEVEWRWLDYINTFTAVFTLPPNHNIAADLLYIDDVINQLLSCFHKIYFI